MIYNLMLTKKQGVSMPECQLNLLVLKGVSMPE